jgi:hypothetical protein
MNPEGPRGQDRYGAHAHAAGRRGLRAMQRVAMPLVLSIACVNNVAGSQPVSQARISAMRTRELQAQLHLRQ